MSHVGQLLHGFREVQKAPLGLLGLALPLRGLITVQHHFFQLFQACNGCKVIVCDGELDALEAQHLRASNVMVTLYRSLRVVMPHLAYAWLDGRSKLMCSQTFLNI